MSATMASTVHYKFKSQKDYDSIGFDGMFISVGDLKKSIVEKKGSRAIRRAISADERAE